MIHNMNHRSQRRLWPFGWKLLGGLILLLAIGALIAASFNGTSWLSILPFLLLLACPLMMVYVMGSMGHSPGTGESHTHSGMPDGTTDLTRLSREAQIRALHGELTRMTWRLEALRQDLERLEAGPEAESENTTRGRR